MRVAIVHDYLTQRGGAERVVLSMLKAFPGAPVYTSLYEPDSTFPEFADQDVRPMWTNRLGLLRADHRRGLPLYPLAFSRLRFEPTLDVVLCSSSGFAHGVRTTARKVVYCHSPARWLYDQAPTYLAGWPGPLRLACAAAAPALRRWDRQSADSADQYLANSSVVAASVHAVYGREASVLPPPVQVDVTGEQQVMLGLEPGFMLCVGRLLAYKNVAAVVAAFLSLPNSTLVVVGEGPERERLVASSPPNVTFAGRVSETQLRWLYANCSGLVSASFEDFGLTPIEAGAFGKPVAVLRGGGFLDTVIEGTTGVFFDTPDPQSIAVGVGHLLAKAWDKTSLVAHASNFSEEGFIAELQVRVVV